MTNKILFFLASTICSTHLLDAIDSNGIYYQQIQRPYVDHKGKLNVPENVNEILDYEFSRNLTLNDINIPSNVQTIGSGSFSHCYNVTSITLSNGLREILSYAFTGLFQVKNLVIPKSVTKIGKNALHMLNLDYLYVSNPNCIIEQQDCLTAKAANVQLIYPVYNQIMQKASNSTPTPQFIVQALYSTDNTQVQQQMYEQPQQIHNVANEPIQFQQPTYMQPQQIHNAANEPIQFQQQMYMQPQQIHNAADEPMQWQQYNTPMLGIDANQMQGFYNM